jgi:hypothetical protein
MTSIIDPATAATMDGVGSKSPGGDAATDTPIADDSPEVAANHADELTRGNFSDRSNATESEAMTLDDNEVFEDARQAATQLKRTFPNWMVIGKAVVLARDIADRCGGGKTFMLLIEQQGLGRIVDKTTASKLLRIMAELPAVTAWHETLTEKQKIDWAAPTTILKRCPVFAKPKPDDDGEQKLTPAEKDRMKLARLIEENHKLKQRDDGDRFKPTDTADDIATVLVGMFSSTKAQDIARRMLAKLKEKCGEVTS